MPATKARDVMTPNADCIGENETTTDAARRMKDEDVGALPICGEDDRLKGMITDRDIAVKVVAQGRDPSSTRVGELAQGEVVTIGADDDVETAIQTMIDHGVRRLPVIDGHRMVGVVAQADLARALPPDRAGELVAAISEQP